MATLARSDSKVVYKDYVNFLASYKNGKKEDTPDVPDFSKPCIPYNTFLENSKSQKFSPVKGVEEKKMQKSELFIEIQAPSKPVSEVSKIFQTNVVQKPKDSSINSKISIFEVQKPKTSHKPVLNRFPKNSSSHENSESHVHQKNTAPPPPPMNMKLQATLKNGSQTSYSIKTDEPIEIDRNNPMVKKLVYGTLRGMYGAYHEKANDIVSTLPRNMVVRTNGVQDKINQMAANGDLEKLTGRANPRVEQE